MSCWLPLVVMSETDRPPNIVLIMADDIGWSDLRSYGNDFIDTPNMDRIAQQGMRFTDAYAMPVCTPTRVSLQSGKNPATLQIQHPNPHHRPYGKLITPPQYWRLPLTETTIAEALAPAGYTSYHVGKWGSGRSRQEHGYVDDPTGAITGPYRTSVNAFAAANPEKRLGDMVHQAVRFMEDNVDRPFYCMLSPIQPHTPLEARPELVAKYREKSRTQRTAIDPRYAAMIETFDETVGLMAEVIEQLGLTDQTLFIVYSDNGGVESERGYVPAGWDGAVTHNWPLRNEKGTLYEGGIRVPLIVRWPGQVAAGVTSHERVVCYDFLPTFADIAGVPIKAGTLDGLSFRPVLGQTAPLNRDEFFWHHPRYHHSTPASAIIAGDYKLIHFYEDGRNELYHLTSDIGESQDLSAVLPEQTAALKAKLDIWLASVNAAIRQPNPHYDERNQLIWGPRDPQTWMQSFALPE